MNGVATSGGIDCDLAPAVVPEDATEAVWKVYQEDLL